VDGDQVLVDVLLDALETRGYNVDSYNSASAALGALGGSAPTVKTRVLVLEEQLPDGSGLDLLETLHSTPGFEATRVLFLTGKQTEEHILRCLDLGVVDNLLKPISFAVLIRKLERALGR
jgi:DNA-binding response OmpR family regulator